MRAAIVLAIASCQSPSPDRDPIVPSPPTATTAPATPPSVPRLEPPHPDPVPPVDVSLATDGGVCDARLYTNLEVAILASTDSRPAEPVHRWDRTTPPAYRDLVDSVLALSPAERDRLARDGFVVPARLAYDDYTTAYFDVHRAQLPIFVTADSIFHAVFVTSDVAIADLERERLLPALVAAIGKLAAKLPDVASDYPADTAHDLGLYLAVAQRLLADGALPAHAEADPIVKLLSEASATTTIEMFGRRRVVDATQFAIRGHYVQGDDLERYFRAAMWLSRVELDLASRDSRSSSATIDPRETPREAVLALALADLADRSGALADLDVVDSAWTTLAGPRDSVSLEDLIALRASAGITTLTSPDVAARLRAAIGNRFRRRGHIDPMPDVANLPVVATPLGARFTADAAALARAQAAGATMSPAAAIGYMLGHDRAAVYLEPTVDRTILASARDELAHVPAAIDLYGTWLGAIRALARPTVGTRPSFIDTPAYADLRLDTAITAYGQLRHDNQLVAAAIEHGGGCEIPDGYVEPVPDVYDALARYAERAAPLFGTSDATRAYYTRASAILRTLAAIARDELSGRRLDDDEIHFLAEVVEQRVHWTFNYDGLYPSTTFDGWYVDLLAGASDARPQFAVDVGTHRTGRVPRVDYLGADSPRMGAFVVDSGGFPRVMVGPVARGFEAVRPLARRETDAAKLAGDAPWERSYTVAAPAEPDFTAGVHRAIAIAKPPHAAPEPAVEDRIWFEAKRPLGPVTIELRDHHFAKIGELAATIEHDDKIPFPPALAAKTESLVVVVGAFRGRVDIGINGFGRAAFGAARRDEP
jgi:hypothetical protein